MPRMRSSEGPLLWRDAQIAPQCRPQWLRSALLLEYRPWMVAAVSDAAAVVVRGAMAMATPAQIDSAGAHTRFAAGTAADCG